LKIRPIFAAQLKDTRKMLIIPVKEGESIDRALKKFKKKFEKTGVIKELRRRSAFIKPSVSRRDEIKKAVYISDLRRSEE
jgi:small subunit ribosomal protein S21